MQNTHSQMTNMLLCQDAQSRNKQAYTKTQTHTRAVTFRSFQTQLLSQFQSQCRCYRGHNHSCGHVHSHSCGHRHSQKGVTITDTVAVVITGTFTVTFKVKKAKY